MANLQQICSLAIPNASGEGKHGLRLQLQLDTARPRTRGLYEAEDIGAITPVRINNFFKGLYDKHGQALIANRY